MTIPVNSTVDSRDVVRLSRQCIALLERLQRGPLSNVDAAVEMRILNLTARVSELRQAGHDVVAKRGAGGVWTYTLVVQGQQSLAGVA